MSQVEHTCSMCGSSNIHKYSYGTNVGSSQFFDDEGKVHNHDNNHNGGSSQCLKCSHQWENYCTPNTCWCGWASGYEYLGYQGIKYRKHSFIRRLIRICTCGCKC